MSSAAAAPPESAPPIAAPPATARLMSLDALRGFDMFWILGADALVRALDRMGENPVTRLLSTQLSHVEWAGFHFYDLIFPLFVFIAGVSSVWSLTKELEQHGRAGACKRVIRRGLLLVVIGIFYSGGFTNEWPNIRLLGVLQRIGLAYLFAGLIFLHFKPRALIGVCAGLLVGYWALLTFWPIRDIQLETAALARRAAAAGDAPTAALFKEGVNPSIVKNHPAWAAAETMFENTTGRVTGHYEKGLNLSSHFDFRFLPGKKYDNYFDPEGILSTLPAIATCLLGILAGVFLRRPDLCEHRKLGYLAAFGVVAVLVGFLWGLEFPVIKKIWTSSFVLVAGGFSALLLAGFYLVVDVWKLRLWCQPFVWIGMNSITVYLANNLLGFRKLAERFAGGDIKGFLDTQVAKGAGDLVLTLTGLGLGVLLCWFLHRRKIYLRL
jgi:predicted acyltransferase